MAETLSPGYEYEQESSQNESESRFGDTARIVEAMRSGEPHVIGNIDDLYPNEISAHTNIVEVVNILQHNSGGTEKPNNSSEPVLIYYGDEDPLLCIFKSYEGENETTKQQHGIDSFYPREVAAYHVSEHFKFDLVPPTTIREVNGKIGSLQLFMEPPDYLSAERFFDNYTADEWQAIQNSNDFQKMAALDYILANGDRKDANYLVRTAGGRLARDGKDQQPNLVAIDHGLSLDVPTFLHFELVGPLFFLTYDNQKKQPRNNKIPAWLGQQIEDGNNRRTELDLTFLPDIPEQQIDALWSRTQNLIDTNSFLSPQNQKLFYKK